MGGIVAGDETLQGRRKPSAIGGKRQRYRVSRRFEDSERQAWNHAIHNVALLANIDAVQLEHGVGSLIGGGQQVDGRALRIVDKLERGGASGICSDRKIIAACRSENGGAYARSQAVDP